MIPLKAAKIIGQLNLSKIEQNVCSEVLIAQFRLLHIICLTHFILLISTHAITRVSRYSLHYFLPRLILLLTKRAEIR